MLPRSLGSFIVNRGAIEKVDNIVPVTASSSLALSQDRRIVIWTIGTLKLFHFQSCQLFLGKDSVFVLTQRLDLVLEAFLGRSQQAPH